MAIPTLVVGLGGTGVLTVRALKRLYAQEPTGELAPAKFLAIDFDRSAMEIAADGRFADLDATEFLYLRPENIQEPLAHLYRGLDGEPAWKDVHMWFPSREDVQIPLSEVEANGAGQFRALGRLGLFVHAEQIENALRKGLDSLPCETDTMTFTRDRRIMVAASLAGGTGSGMLIDFAYLARRQPARPRIYAYLLLPEVFAEKDQGGRIYQNAYAALRELAHFKDQQIPFQAEHWQVPAIDIPIGGEEPFTRIFLFGRQLCSGDDPVTSSCQNAAQAALAQLNRTIQEKTLAIVANTASADVIDERHRRRTHCFSSAGSHSMRLGMKEISQDVILKHVLLTLHSDERLREVFAPALELEARRSEEALNPSGQDVTGTANAAGDAGDESAEAERRARRVARRFKESISRVADEGAQRLLDWLNAELKHTHAESALDYEAAADRAWKAIDDLYEILLRSAEEEKRQRDAGPESPDVGVASKDDPARSPLGRALDEFRAAVPAFSDIESSIHHRISELLQLSREVQSPKELMARHLFVSEVLRFINFFILFKPDEQDPRQALREQWKRLDELHGTEAKKQPWWRNILPWRKNILPSKQKKKLISLGRVKVLQEAAKLPQFKGSLRTLFLARAAAELRGRLRAEKRRLEQRLRALQEVWRVDIVPADAVPDELPKLPKGLEKRLEGLLLDKLPKLLAEAQERTLPDYDEDRKKQILRSILERHILNDEKLKAALYVLQDEEGSTEKTKKRIIANFVAARQDVFVRRTPNPQRKGFAIVLTPEGIVWPEGEDRFDRFLDCSAEQILECRSQTMRYRGERLWFYFEDLFNPPEHIRNLDDYYHSYQGQAHPELFHIDRRLLENKNFRDIYAGSHRLVVTCGNPGCSTNIAYEDRARRVCPGCHRMIRSRCGNRSCRQDELHKAPGRHDRSCPSCGGFNGASWWRCDRHGKKEVLVSVDKPRCPECVARHQEDPVAYPEDRIGRRPDTIEVLECPHCQTLARENASHEPFLIRNDLLPFYRNGVNGHDRDRYLKLAQNLKLPEDFRCPKCRTALIPFHHRELKVREASP